MVNFNVIPVLLIEFPGAQEKLRSEGIVIIRLVILRSSSFILLRWTMNLSLVVFLSPRITHLIYGQAFAFQQQVCFETMHSCRIIRLQNQSWKSVKFP